MDAILTELGAVLLQKKGPTVYAFKILTVTIGVYPKWKRNASNSVWLHETSSIYIYEKTVVETNLLKLFLEAVCPMC